MAATQQTLMNNAEYGNLGGRFGCKAPVIYSKNFYDVLDCFTDVPVEILCCIIEKLTAEDLVSLSQVSSEWRTVALDSTLWKRHCIEHVAKSPCRCCAVDISGTMADKAAIYGWTDVFMTAKQFHQGVRWGQVCGTPDEARLSNLQFNEKRTTLKNLRGRWVSVRLGDFTLANEGVYHFTFKVDSFTCNGMMIGLANSRWQGMYPGTGNAGVSSTSASCAYYSHTSSIYSTGDIICLRADLKNNKISFHKNGECVGTVEAPARAAGEELMVVGSFCGTQHQISVLASYAHPPHTRVHM